MKGTGSGTDLLPDFDPGAFPLNEGIRLLEASAGTGKTFALAHLVLRMVAEGGISLRRLLVVTFTEAAAAELRDRIGRRLQDGLSALESDAVPPPDPVLEQWLESVERGTAAGQTRLRGRLLLALEELDSADITTIHGFSRRTLRRQALEAALPPDLKLEKDPDGLISEIVHDYWQQHILPLPAGCLASIRRQVRPDDLRHALNDLDGDPALQLDPLPEALPLEQPLHRTLPALILQRWVVVKQLWSAGGRNLEEAFRTASAHWRTLSGAKTTPYSPRPRSDRCAVLDGWIAELSDRLERSPAEAAGQLCEALAEQKLLHDYFHPGVFCRVARRFETGSPSLPQATLLEAIAALVDGPAELVALHACHWGRGELQRRRHRTGSCSFSQLLEDLDPLPPPGEDGSTREEARRQAVLEAVAERYDVALIDEFQDTDPIQWRILSRAFGQGRHRLVMVGDPKQAIYRFRGGDLDTYRRARDQADQRFGLRRNFRATPALVSALNTLMAPGLPRSLLPVPAVEACSGRSGAQAAPIELIWLGRKRAAGEPPPSGSELEDRLSDLVAGHTADLLTQKEPLWRPSDICLLVGTHHQAEDLRLALDRWGIASRLVSKADVFASPAATALQRFLDALADPADPGRLRLLAASPLLGWSAATIAAADAHRWSSLAGKLDSLGRDLESRGLLGALAALLGSPGLARLSLGGRLLADLQQVAELVEEHIHAERAAPAMAADWLRRIRLDPGRSLPESHRPNSDRADGAVAVVTVHRSKGLEFPVVICPYLWQSPDGGRSWGLSRPVRWKTSAAAAPHLDLHRSRHWGQGFIAIEHHFEQERGERERLAYVALTRAKELLVLAWGPAAGHQCSPLFPWLFSGDPLPEPGDDPLPQRSDDDWKALLKAEASRRQLAMRVVDPPSRTPPSAPATLRGPTHALGLGPVPTHRFETGWGRSSYSSWTHGGAAGIAPSAEEGRDTIDPSPEEGATAEAGQPDWAERGPLADFPRGAVAGDCLHRILERLHFDQSPSSEQNLELVRSELQRSGLQDQPLDTLLQGLGQTLQTPCGGRLGLLSLGALPMDRRLHELHFDLTLARVRAADLAAAFLEHPGGAFGDDYARRLATLSIDSCGFLTGSIDLVFPAPTDGAERRWWVADWKSNWIGRRDNSGRPEACGPLHYGAAAMTRLMAANHYPLQAHLYLVALHRYLRWRLPAYDPGQHLGGYLYVFLRGTPGARHPAAGSADDSTPLDVPGMFVEMPPLERILALDRTLGVPEHGMEGP